MSKNLLSQRLPAEVLRHQLEQLGATSNFAGIDCVDLAASMSVRDAMTTLIEVLPKLPDLDTTQIGSPKLVDSVKRNYAALAVLKAIMSKRT